MQLSPSQQKRFVRWLRLADIVECAGKASQCPVVVAASGVDADRVRQQSVPDCSVIASLCIAARYEQTHKQPLISGIIYPQDASGRPVYNAYGRYLVRLFFNGCFRRVEVDDLLPADAHGRPLCAHSSDPTEFWPAILEKAYLKLCNGGYHFPGSNSSIDMHAFTGWLPERFDLKDEQALHSGRVWPRLQSAMQSGDCLATVGTGSMSPADEERTGLVSGHAYAVLSAHEVPRNSANSAAAAADGDQGTLKLVRLKNPWAKKVWRGRFSPFDSSSWTPQLQHALGSGAGTQHADDGTFFIDFDALRHAFERLYLAWSPHLFAHRQVLHGQWAASAPGPVDDRYNISRNPQFLLDVQVPKRRAGYMCALWLLLTRHVTQRDAAEEEAAAVSAHSAAGEPGAAGTATPYLSLQLHGKKSLGQQHVVLPDCSSPAVASAWASKTRNVFLSAPAETATPYSANPHILLRHDLEPGHHQLTVVISQLKRLRDVDYTIRAWCMERCQLKPPPCGMGPARVVSCSWTPSGQEHAILSKELRLGVPCDCSVFLELQAAKDDAVQFELGRMHRDAATQEGDQTHCKKEDPALKRQDVGHSAAGSADGAAAPASGPDAALPAASAAGSASHTQPGAARPVVLCSSGSWRKCYTAKTVLGLSAGSYTLRVQCLQAAGAAPAAAPRPFLCSCRMLQDSAAANFVVKGCSLVQA